MREDRERVRLKIDGRNQLEEIGLLEEVCMLLCIVFERNFLSVISQDNEERHTIPG